WVEMDGSYYSVVQQESSGEWALTAQEGHCPLLSHNGAGAWRLWSEQPAEWDDPYFMFRRLGEDAQGLDNEQIAQALTAH
ncbi:hypothetical protein NL393_39185, partial [Klebsiella pneumoniae]|nr:hypothetical protein [Klebsiella pneumoniae]